jgi:hypothetical protein
MDIETGRFVSTERVLGKPLGQTLEEEKDTPEEASGPESEPEP